LSLPPSHYYALALTVAIPSHIPTDHPSDFVLTLKNELPGRRPDGRRESVVSYEFSFDLRKLHTLERIAEAKMGEGNKVKLVVRWDALVATYRGREDKEAPALDPTSIHE
jgi:hypothetical protein